MAHGRRLSGWSGLACGLALTLSAGCSGRHGSAVSELVLADAVELYAARQADRLQNAAAGRVDETLGAAVARSAAPSNRGSESRSTKPLDSFDSGYVLLGELPATQPVAAVPEGYWRRNVWHQMGREGLEMGRHGLWAGFRTAFWDLENALVLTAAMGTSVAIRGTGVDDAVRSRTDGNRQLGEFDETIQLLGNPGVHFAGAGVVWLTSTLTKDAKQHEFAKTLGQALAVNGLTTLGLKAATNTHAPDGEGMAWPSGHTSSAFTAAAVINEYYGPWAGVPSLALAGLVGYQRLDSRVHDFSDVVFGAVLGYVVGSSIARDNRAELPQLFGMEVVPYADPETGSAGIALMKRF